MQTQFKATYDQYQQVVAQNLGQGNVYQYNSWIDQKNALVTRLQAMQQAIDQQKSDVADLEKKATNAAPPASGSGHRVFSWKMRARPARTKLSHPWRRSE
jgi:hypothetical protein